VINSTPIQGGGVIPQTPFTPAVSAPKLIVVILQNLEGDIVDSSQTNNEFYAWPPPISRR